MTVTIEYMSQLRLRLGCGGETCELAQGSTVGDLVAAVARRHGASAEKVLLEREKPAPTLLCFVGDEQAGFERELSDGESVVLMTPISGG